MSRGHPYTVGLLLRREFMALVDELGLYATEHWGLLQSTFVVRGDDRARLELARIMLDYAERVAADERRAAEELKRQKERKRWWQW